MNITYLISATHTKPPPKISNCPSCPHYRSCPTMTQIPICIVTSWRRWRYLSTVTYYRSILTSHSRFRKIYNPRSKTYLDLEKKMICNCFCNRSKAYNYKKNPNAAQKSKIGLKRIESQQQFWVRILKSIGKMLLL